VIAFSYIDGRWLNDKHKSTSTLATLAKKVCQPIMAKEDDTSQRESEADDAQSNNRGARGRGQGGENEHRDRRGGSRWERAGTPFVHPDQGQQGQMPVPTGHPGAPQPPSEPRFTQRNNQRAYLTAGNNTVNIHGDGNPNNIPLGPRRLRNSASDDQSTEIPQAPTTVPSLESGPNYAAVASSREARTGISNAIGDRSQSALQLENALSHSNSANAVPAANHHASLRTGVRGTGTRQASALPRGERRFGAAAGQARARDRTDGREASVRLGVGDLVNFVMVKNSLVDEPARMIFEDGELKFKGKGVYRFYPSDAICEEYGLPLGVYWESRYGVVVAVFHGDSVATATIIPEFTYSGKGAWQNKNETVPKSLAFCAEHIGIMNRSQVDARMDYETTVTNTRNREGPDSAKYSRGTTAAQPNPHPYAPWDCVATIDRDCSHKPKRNSLLRLSGFITVYDDDRITKVGKLEDASRDFVRDIYLKFMTISTLGMDERQNLDVGRYSWLRGLDPNFQAHLPFWTPESDATGALTQDKDRASPGNGIPSSLTGLARSASVDPGSSSPNESRGSTSMDLESRTPSESGGSRTEEDWGASGTRKRTAEATHAASSQELVEHDPSESDSLNLEDDASGTQPASAEDSQERAHKRQRTDTAVDDKGDDLGETDSVEHDDPAKGE